VGEFREDLPRAVLPDEVGRIESRVLRPYFWGSLTMTMAAPPSIFSSRTSKSQPWAARSRKRWTLALKQVTACSGRLSNWATCCQVASKFWALAACLKDSKTAEGVEPRQAGRAGGPEGPGISWGRGGMVETIRRSLEVASIRSGGGDEAVSSMASSRSIGGVGPMLRSHFNNSLNVGLTPRTVAAVCGSHPSHSWKAGGRSRSIRFG